MRPTAEQAMAQLRKDMPAEYKEADGRIWRLDGSEWIPIVFTEELHWCLGALIGARGHPLL